MSDLVDFLRARLDEDERSAQAGSEPGGPHWPDSEIETRTPQIEHARRHDPARVLAEVEAKRRIIEHHRQDAELCSVCDSAGPAAQGWPCFTLRLLALPYADHPDYRDEWRP